jgi:hypothetical protein
MTRPIPAPTCLDCRFFLSEPQALEHALPGFNILSSAYGAVRGSTAICGHRGIFIMPAPACSDFLDSRRSTL